MVRLILAAIYAIAAPSPAQQAGLSVWDGRLVIASRASAPNEADSPDCQVIDLKPKWDWETSASLYVYHREGPLCIEFDFGHKDPIHAVGLILTQHLDGSIEVDAQIDGEPSARASFASLSEMTDLGVRHTIDNWLAADSVACLKRAGVSFP